MVYKIFFLIMEKMFFFFILLPNLSNVYNSPKKCILPVYIPGFASYNPNLDQNRC